MAHELSTTKSGLVRFVYNPDGGSPWHRLGTPVDGERTLEAMLALSHSEYMVQKFPLFTLSSDGELIPVESHFMTGFDEVVLGDDGMSVQRTHFAPVGTVYAVEQNYDAAVWARDLQVAAGGDAQIETMGALGEGERFFVCVSLPDLVVDPTGVADRIQRFISVVVYHNGQHGLRAVNSDVRTVCNNTLQWALQSGAMIATIRHTAGKEQRKEQAIEIVRARAAASIEAKVQAEKMLAIPAGVDELRTVADGVFGAKRKDMTARQEKLFDQRWERLVATFFNDKNVGAVGENGWSVYNTVTEYVDHERPRVGGRQRMEQAIEPMSEASKLKAKAAQRVLALA